MLMTEDKPPSSSIDLAERLSPILPTVARLIPDAYAQRDLPAATIEALRRADLIRLFQPRRWGGFEADPRCFYALQNRIAEVCGSTAWVYGVLCVQAFVLALFDERAQADVWGEDPRALVCSSFAPVGSAVPAEGGYRLSGRWSFSSGSSHARWTMLGAKLSSPASPPGLTLFLVPREDFEIRDVWHTFGLRGTGSNDIVAQDIFVPVHRSFTLDPGIQNRRSEDRPGSPLYRMPWLYLFASSISNWAVGAARGALASFLDVTRARVSPLSGKVAKEDPAAQQAAARLLAEIDTVEAMYDRHITMLQRHVSADTIVPLREAWLCRSQLTAALRNLAAKVDALMLLQGARAIELDSPVARAWLDLSAARAHIGNDPTIATTMLGAELIAGD
ncbi:acyl-CoA dehydrogenase family protein [Flavisphingomonas formosensis]|uniref:flavin-dependent monooxygenase n=1 Tax=Flavisphingomonas formosensis TaxID=861534 RepID=UPI0012FC9FEA|nr:flavin-dependent monooxygenase [Sphingomonas formosensis]